MKQLIPFVTWSLALLLVSSCTEGPLDPKPCPRRGPTFRVGIVAEGSELPSDVAVIVHYGSNTEGFDLERGNGENQDVCCRVEAELGRMESVSCLTPRDAALPEHIGALECELNTNGAARVTVTASGYEVLEGTLEAQRLEGEKWAHCNALVTREVVLHLSRGDAGP